MPIRCPRGRAQLQRCRTGRRSRPETTGHLGTLPKGDTERMDEKRLKRFRVLVILMWCVVAFLAAVCVFSAVLAIIGQESWWMVLVSALLSLTIVALAVQNTKRLRKLRSS